MYKRQVDMYVQELENMPANAPDLESRIRLHVMMQQELERQEDDLSALEAGICLLYTSPSPRDRTRSRMPASA